MATTYSDYAWYTQDGKRTARKITASSEEKIKEKLAQPGYSAMTAVEKYNAPDTIDKQNVERYNTQLSKIQSGEGKWYWRFQQDVSNFQSGQHIRDAQWIAKPAYSSTGDFAEIDKQWYAVSPANRDYAPPLQWMSAEESKLQTDILTQKRDIAQANINLRQQEFSNRQTQANVSQTPSGSSRGSSTRRKEKRGGRASTLLAGTLGGARANVATRQLLGG